MLKKQHCVLLLTVLLTLVLAAGCSFSAGAAAQAGHANVCEREMARAAEHDLGARDEAGQPAGRERFLGLVYNDLVRIARAELNRHRRGATLDTCALVNEAYLKLFEGAGLDYENRRHFYATAARAMRQVVIDHARARLAERRGGGAEHVALDALEGQPLPVDAQAEQLLAMDPSNPTYCQLAQEGIRYFHELGTTIGTSRRRIQFQVKPWLKGVKVNNQGVLVNLLDMYIAKH